MARNKGGKKQAQPKAPRKKSGNKGGIKTVVAVALLTLISGIVILSLYGDKIFKQQPVKKSVHQEKPVIKPQTQDLSLYFSDEEGLYLKAERRSLKKGPLEAEAKEALEALIDGPKTGLANAIPKGTRLLGLKIKGSTAYPDFSFEIIKNHPGGTSGELQTIYSIIDTLALNFPEIKDVQILVDGKKEATLAGHIDISMPLGPDKKIIKN